MKSIILAAGYATRLYPLTIVKPKALLPLVGKPILDYIVEEITTINEIDEIIIVSNHKFYEHFSKWAESASYDVKLNVVDDNTISDDDKLGAVGDIPLVIDKCGIDEDTLIIAGDTFFTFKLKDFYDYHKSVDSDCILCKRIKHKDDLKRIGVVQLDCNNKVIGMEEKPSKPKSDTAAFAAYIYSADTVGMIKQYLAEGNNPDAPGFLPSWLHSRKDLYRYVFEGECYDIGTPLSYREVNDIFAEVAANEE